MCILLLLFTACRKKPTSPATPMNPYADSCCDATALNYVAGGEHATTCRYATTSYTGQYSIVDTYTYIDYYGTAEDRWDTAISSDTITVSMIDGKTLRFSGILTLSAFDSSFLTTDNTHYLDSLPYSHSSSRTGSSGSYTYYASCTAKGVFRHDSLFYRHDNSGSSMTDNFRHRGYGVKL